MSFSSRLFAAALIALLTSAVAGADLAPIQIDGYFDDWDAVTAVHDDSNDDAGPVDFGRIWVANDQDYLFFRFETEGEVQPDEQQNMRLYIDTDMNSSTGTYFNGIGAELMWEFGWKEGTFKDGGTYTVDQYDVGLQMGPTVSNTDFEVAFKRNAVPAGGQSLFNGSDIRFILRDTDSADVAPSSGSITYTFAPGTIATPSLSLARQDPAHIRLATWNVKGDGLFDGGDAEAAQNRLLDAMDPDILIVNEVWDHTASQVRTIIEQHLPSGAGEGWYAIKRDDGNVVVSRYPILQSWLINSSYRLTGVLLDLGETSAKDLLVIACHWRCCTADDDRQKEADSIIGFLRDAKDPGGVITLPEGTPFVLGGDLNLVGWRQQLDTILTGDIQNEGTYGPDDAPDWDGADFADPRSRQPDVRLSYTWRNDCGYLLSRHAGLDPVHRQRPGPAQPLHPGNPGHDLGEPGDQRASALRHSRCQRPRAAGGGFLGFRSPVAGAAGSEPNTGPGCCPTCRTRSTRRPSCGSSWTSPARSSWTSTIPAVIWYAA